MGFVPTTASQEHHPGLATTAVRCNCSSLGLFDPSFLEPLEHFEVVGWSGEALIEDEGAVVAAGWGEDFPERQTPSSAGISYELPRLLDSDRRIGMNSEVGPIAEEMSERGRVIPAGVEDSDPG